jgi:hypothetical protein
MKGSKENSYLTPWSGDLPEKLTCAQQVKNYPRFKESGYKFPHFISWARSF